MIDIYAIATDGYISNESKALSVAVNGYYPSNVVMVITPPMMSSVKSSVFGSGERSIEIGHRQEDEDLLILIKIFMDLWH